MMMTEYENGAIDLSAVSNRELWEEFRRRGFTEKVATRVVRTFSEQEMARRKGMSAEDWRFVIRSQATRQLAEFLFSSDLVDHASYEEGLESIEHRFSMTVVKFPNKKPRQA